MKTLHPFPMLSCTFLVLAGLAACEKSPNAEVKSAQTELTSEQQKAAEENAELRRKQQEERMETGNVRPEDQAELRRKQQEERAETAAEGQLSVSEAQRDVTHAREKMAQDRRDFGTKSSERLVKLDARAQELKTKSGKLTGAKKQTFNSDYTRYMNMRDAASAKINALGTVSDENWQSTKMDVDKKLDNLEDELDKLDKEL